MAQSPGFLCKVKRRSMKVEQQVERSHFLRHLLGLDDTMKGRTSKKGNGGKAASASSSGAKKGSRPAKNGSSADKPKRSKYSFEER